MPLYFFHVRNGAGDFADQDGTELPDARSAMDYARKLARELMVGNESSKRHWHVVVCDAERNELFDMPFVTIDESIQHLNADSRQLIETMCEKRLALAETLFETRMNVLRVRANIARSRARPYIASEFGHAVGQAKRKP